METLNLAIIIERYKLNKKELATILFPDNKHSDMAIQRILSGEGRLDANQVLVLANYAGCTVNDLYTYEGWTQDNTKPKKNTLTFTKGKFKAVLDTGTGVTSIYNGNKTLLNKVIHTNTMISIDEYIKLVESQINTFINH